jgi:hypothetical protein
VCLVANGNLIFPVHKAVVAKPSIIMQSP